MSVTKAGKSVLKVSGRSGEALMLKMIGNEKAEMPGNSVCWTVYKFRNTTCSLYGSHGSCGVTPQFSCEIILGF